MLENSFKRAKFLRIVKRDQRHMYDHVAYYHTQTLLFCDVQYKKKRPAFVFQVLSLNFMMQNLFPYCHQTDAYIARY